jgi:hypothetical protein
MKTEELVQQMRETLVFFTTLSERGDDPVGCVREEAASMLGVLDSLAAALEAANARADAAEAKVEACGWYWPDGDTEAEVCQFSAQDAVDYAYETHGHEDGEVVLVERGGVVEQMYCASLSPAKGVWSTEHFWVQEATEDAARAKINAELSRRAALASEASS